MERIRKVGYKQYGNRRVVKYLFKCPICASQSTIIGSRIPKCKCVRKSLKTANIMILRCPCGKEFEAVESHKRIFCSKECQLVYRGKGYTQDIIENIGVSDDEATEEFRMMGDDERPENLKRFDSGFNKYLK